MNALPFIPEVGSVPTPKSISFENLFLVVALICGIGTLVYFLIKPKESDKGDKLSAVKASALLK